MSRPGSASTSRSGWWLTDVLAGVGVTLLGAGAVYVDAPGAVRIPLVVLLVLVLPGYALLGALYPVARTREVPAIDERGWVPGPVGLGPVERAALTPVLSVAVVAGAAGVANATPYGVTYRPVLAIVVGVTLLGFLGTVVARGRRPPAVRVAVSPGAVLAAVRLRARRGLGDSGADRYDAALVASLLLVAVSGGYALAVPHGGPAFTEFSVDTPNVTSETDSLYPHALVAGEPTDLGFVVGNHEGEDASYEVVLVLRGPDGSGASTLARQAVTVPDGERRAVELTVVPETTGADRQLLALLYRGSAPDQVAPATAYRTLRLPVAVEGEG